MEDLAQNIFIREDDIKPVWDPGVRGTKTSRTGPVVMGNGFTGCDPLQHDQRGQYRDHEREHDGREEDLCIFSP